FSILTLLVNRPPNDGADLHHPKCRQANPPAQQIISYGKNGVGLFLSPSSTYRLNYQPLSLSQLGIP
ncbi:TPA: hypothetical protein ACJFLK_003844, partial [Escherichia coli]